MAEGVVYFVQGLQTEYVKIGFAADFYARLSQLKSAGADPIHVLGIMTVSEPRVVERKLHKKFRADRVHHEWFRPSQALIRYIAEHTEFVYTDDWEPTAYQQALRFARQAFKDGYGPFLNGETDVMPDHPDGGSNG